MIIRGAGTIGATAAYGMAQAFLEGVSLTAPIAGHRQRVILANRNSDCRAVNPALGVRRISKNALESTRTKPVALIWKPPQLSEARIIIEDFRRDYNQQRPRSQPSCQI